MKKLALCFSVIILFLLQSCGKEGDYIDDVPVDIQLQLGNPAFSSLNSSGGYVTIKGGVAGIIIYRTGKGRLVAYDRCSSYNPENKCAVEVSFITAKDPCSASIFSLEDGSSLHAPATRPLKQYSVIETNNSQIRIFN